MKSPGGEEERMPVANEGHPYDFYVSGPRNVGCPNWREIFTSSWKDDNYKRTVVACFIQAVYLMELDRQENRRGENALAPKWWLGFKYKLSQTLVDERDGSIFGAVLEWDRSAAFADMILVKPSRAPRAVLALRGTLIRSPTIRRDVEDDLRFLAWETLEGSARFQTALVALKSISELHGSSNVCVTGHSLGAGFAFQVAKSLAKQGVFVESHLFNPPSLSLAMTLRNMGEKVGLAWERFKSMLPRPRRRTAQAAADEKEVVVVGEEKLVVVEEEKDAPSLGLMNWVLGFARKNAAHSPAWGLNLYVNNSDYICSYYAHHDGLEDHFTCAANRQAAAKLFIMSKGKQKFLEAHGLEQWWSKDLNLQQALHKNKLLSSQLKSLHSFSNSHL